MKRLSGLAVGLVALAFVGVAPAATVTIDISTGLSGGNNTVTCEGSGCEGFFDKNYKDAPVGASFTGFSEDLELSPVSATAWNLSPSDEATSVSFLNNMIDKLGLQRALLSTADKTEVNKVGHTFETDLNYFWIKQGVWTAFFVNPTPGELVKVTVLGDLSNYGVVGVPIPAAFVLFGSGLVGLGWLARRQRARKDSVV